MDDFFVADSALWPTAGMALLEQIQRAASAASAGGAARVVVVVAQRDEPKRALLRSAAYSLAAAWWVRPLMPASSSAPPASPAPDGIEVRVALALGDAPAAQVARFDQWAAASGAALAVIPARVTNVALAEALAQAGYIVASAWYVRAV